MAMSYVWCFLLLVSIAYSIFAGTAPQTGSAALSGAQSGVTLAISLAGVLCLWSGLSRVMEKSGLAAKLASLLRPLLARLFPDSARDAAALQNLSGNFTANLLGLGSAATPLGIAAVRRMQWDGEPGRLRRDVPSHCPQYRLRSAHPIHGRCRPCLAWRAACI